MLKCFIEQDYPDRELIILDDAGQYNSQEGNRWKLVSIDKRYPTLGDKRNAAADLVSDDVEALAVWDDDDWYLPWALSASVATLKISQWSRPSVVLHETLKGELRQHRTGGLFHGGWAYHRDMFLKVGGYPSKNNGEDQALARRFKRKGLVQSDPIRLDFDPFYIYKWGGRGDYHLSGMGADGYEKLGMRVREKASLNPILPRNYHNPTILPGVNQRIF